MKKDSKSSYLAVGVSTVTSPEIGSYFIRGCLQGIVLKGFDPSVILAKAQIDPSAYSDPHARINGQQLQRLMQTIRRTLNDEFLGFLEVAYKPEMAYMVVSSAVKCLTLGQALTKVTKIINAVRSDIEIHVDLNADNFARMTFKSSGYVKGINPQILSWISLFNFYKFQCWFIGQRINLTGVGIAASKPEVDFDFSRLFNCPVEFNQERTQLTFSRDYLNLRIVRGEADARHPDLALGDQDWFTVPGSDQLLAIQVEQMLINHYQKGGGAINLDVMGDVFCCSPRTLSRRLQKEGVSFQTIKDKVRIELARKLLLKTNMTVAEISDRVGFSEPGDFTRAFTAWTGSAPSDYRVQYQK